MLGNSENGLHGRAKAGYLVAEIGKRVHVGDAHLDADDDRSFGDLGFKYDSKRDTLIGRVFIAKADLDFGPEFTANVEKVGRGLNNPRIGGLFEQGGGYFVLDHKRQKFFLMKDFPIETTGSKELWSQMEDLIDFGGRWTFQVVWTRGDITHGHEQPPAHPVTRKNDSHPRSKRVDRQRADPAGQAVWL